MSTMEEARLRAMYDQLCEVLDKVAEALHVVGQPNNVVIEAAQEMKLRAFRAEAERDAAKRLVDIMRDHHDREVRELRAELDVVRSRLMTLTIERDTLRRSEDAERAYRERQNAQTLAEVKALGAKLRGES
jgi:ATP-dependent Clp protease ATP-binding subunit ClpA